MTAKVCQGLPAEVYGFYVLGALDGTELDELQSHLAIDCAYCTFELAVARGIWHGVGLAAPSAEPRRALRNRVINLVQDPDKSAFRVVWWQPAAGLASLALAAILGWQVAGMYRPPVPVVQVLPAPSGTTSQTLTVLERENQALRDRLAAAERASTGSPRTLQPPAARIPPDGAGSANNAAVAALAKQQELLVATQQELARQKELVANAERNAAEANRKYTAALGSQPKPEAAEDQRQQLLAAQTRVQQLERDLVQYKALLVSARQRLEAPVRTASLLADPNLKIVKLRGTVKGSPIEGHALLASGSQVIFYGSRLPALPPGRAYQLWLIRGSAPAIVSAGVFQPDAQQRATVQFESASLTSGITAVAVTDEPETGSTLPTGHKLLIGS